MKHRHYVQSVRKERILDEHFQQHTGFMYVASDGDVTSYLCRSRMTQQHVMEHSAVLCCVHQMEVVR